MMPRHHCPLIGSITIIIAHCHHHHAGKQGTGDDAQASLPACRHCAAAAAAAAITIVCEGQVMMPRHHCAAAAVAAIVQASVEQVMMPRHHRLHCCRSDAHALLSQLPSRKLARDR
jgi:hypothetical protein